MGSVATAVPSSPGEFIAMYRGFVTGLVAKAGVASQDVDDVTADILEAELKARNRLGQEVGILALYDPEHTSMRTGQPVKVTFRAFLANRVSLRIRGKRESLQKRAGRELLLQDGGQDSWFDLFGPSACDDYSALDEAEFVATVRNQLARAPRRSESDTCDLIALFDELVAQVHDRGCIDRSALQQHFHVGETTVSAWMSRLRQAMTGAQPRAAAESFEVGGVILTLADIRQAIEILRRSRGIMVKQPLASAGHPLARAAAGWYHPFSRQEIADFPEIAIDPQTNKKPAGHVKIGVIHRLERMLGFAMAESAAPADPEPEVPESPADLLEAKLWAAGIQDAGVVDEIKAMAEELERYRSRGVTAA
jgi:hypothetical protein